MVVEYRNVYNVWSVVTSQVEQVRGGERPWRGRRGTFRRQHLSRQLLSRTRTWLSTYY